LRLFTFQRKTASLLLPSLQGFWNKLFVAKATGKGTLRHLAGVLSAGNLPSDAKKDLNRVEDFLQTVTEGHVCAALMKYFRITKTDQTPNWQLPNDLQARAQWISRHLDQFLDHFADLTLPETPVPGPGPPHFPSTHSLSKSKLCVLQTIKETSPSAMRSRSCRSGSSSAS